MADENATSPAATASTTPPAAASNTTPPSKEETEKAAAAKPPAAGPAGPTPTATAENPPPGAPSPPGATPVAQSTDEGSEDRAVRDAAARVVGGIGTAQALAGAQAVADAHRQRIEEAANTGSQDPMKPTAHVQHLGLDPNMVPIDDNRIELGRAQQAARAGNYARQAAAAGEVFVPTEPREARQAVSEAK